MRRMLIGHVWWMCCAHARPPHGAMFAGQRLFDVPIHADMHSIGCQRHASAMHLAPDIHRKVWS